MRIHTTFLLAGAGLLALLSMQGQSGTPVERGRALFDHSFHRVDGVGSPEMNADSCRACHSDPEMGGAGPLELNVSRAGRDNGGAGPFTNVAGGQGLSKLYPPFTRGREECPTEADCFEQRQTPTLFGVGLIETIPGFVITANEDPTDADQDGVFGVARRVTINGTVEIGKFGWKAQIPRLRDFVHDAMFQELGITTPDEGRGFGLFSDSDTAPDPELLPGQVDDLEAFMASLPAPQRKNSTDPRVALGLQHFYAVGCAKCHTPVLLGNRGPVPLYSNLLLHNVAPTGFRGMAEDGAPSGFYRTPPLWGIGDTAPYMHDGAAETLRDAIGLHFGEANAVRLAFEALPAADQDALLVFLADL